MRIGLAGYYGKGELCDDLIEIEFEKVADVCSTLDYPYWFESNTSLTEFEKMYFNLIHNWEELNRVVQSKIKIIKNNLINFARRILTEAI